MAGNSRKVESTPDAVKARFESIRCCYRRYRVAMNKSLALGKSGSGAKIAKLPKPYKYAAEAAFLDPSFKMEPVIKSMDSLDNTSNEGDEDLSDSLISLGECPVPESDRSGRKRKNTTESDFNTVLVDAVQSIGKLSRSVMESRKKEMIDEFDGDWLFAKAMYVKLKEVPEGREKEMCKVRIHTEVMNVMYGAQSTRSTNASSARMT